MAKTRRKPSSKAQSSGTSNAKKTPRSSKPSKPRAHAPTFPATILTVTNTHLGILPPEGAVELLRDILRVEARRIGLPMTSINISAWVDVPDGGIDATVTAEAASLSGSIIKAGRTGFQVKAGGGFEPWKKSHVKRALFDTKPPSRENLGPSVTACLEAQGTYVLVCTGCDLPDAQERMAIGHFNEFFRACGFGGAKVEIWSQNKLIGILGMSPSLSLKVNGNERARFQTHRGWSQQEDMRKEYQAGDEQREFISTVRAGLDQSGQASHIRIIGEPGVGKTRAVLEATATDDLAPLVVYCDSATKFRDSELMNVLLRDDNDFSAVLVIDECDFDAAAYLWNKFANRGPRIRLISIYNEPDPSRGTTTYGYAPPLANEQIISIFQGYGVPADGAERWVEFCSGSPRVAHVIGANLKSNPDDLLRPPDTVNVWDRYIVGTDNPQSDRVRQRRTVLEYLALFKRFGFGPQVRAESQAIAAMIREADSQITFPRFEEIVWELRNRRILQGENTLYITPKALHIKLRADWWDKHADSFELNGFYDKLTGNLAAWFDEMARYGAESEAALRIVARLLGESGPFADGSYLRDRRGARLFLALTDASPERALDLLKRTIGMSDRAALLEFQQGRREVVWALERIVVWRELFSDAARLLLQLAEAENETWGNNATGIFAGLFVPGRGAVSPTEASLEERFPVLKEALESGSSERRAVALKAANAALETYHFSRMSGAERQGLRQEPKLWVPKTWGELFDGYRRVWNLVRERLDSLEDEERKEAVKILLGRARGVGRIPNLAGMVIETLGELGHKAYVERKEVIEAVEGILHYERKEMPVETREQWRALRDALMGTGFHALMERYVGMDLLEDKFDEDGKHADKVGPRIQGLAAQAHSESALLDAEFDWLVTDAAKNGFRFGHALGVLDSESSQLPRIIEAMRNAGDNASAFFAGGYVRALRERDSDAWERTLDELAADEQLRRWVPELTWRGGPSDRGMLRVVNLVRDGHVPVTSFGIFAFGGVIQHISEEVFQAVVELLLETGERRAVFIALELYDFHYNHPKESTRGLANDPTLRLLTAPALFGQAQGQRPPRVDTTMEDHHWTEVAKAFVDKYPESSLALADVMLEHFGEDGTIVGGFRSQTHGVLGSIVRRFPGEMWERITKYLGPPIDARGFHLRSWLHGDESEDGRGGPGVFSFIPLQELWRWVDADVDKRAWYLAYMAPKQLFRDEGRPCLAREVLIRYGHRDDVRKNLIANFWSGTWWGPESVHYERKKQELIEFREGETQANVRRWIDEYVVALDHDIERARIEEERGH